MNAFNERAKKHAEHIKNVGQHCTTEETTKQALILPFLDILGFSPFDPFKVKAEYKADFPGAKSSERVDYALFCHGVPVMFVEAKAYSEKLQNHCPQLSRYFNATPEVTIAAITNGKEWRFFTDLDDKNMMDKSPFLVVDFEEVDDSLIARLFQFRHDEFQPEALRTLAEETIYLNAFTKVISDGLRNPDAEFVRFVANRAEIKRQLNAKFLETISPIIKQAIKKSVSDMVVSGLSSRPEPVEQMLDNKTTLEANSEYAKIIDPDNEKIITTYVERRLFEVVKEIVGDNQDIFPKDTESYFSVIFKNKVNRWIVRYYSDKRSPKINISVPMTEERKKEVERAGLSFGSGESILLPNPEHLFRISGIIFDALEYVKNDENFKRQGSSL